MCSLELRGSGEDAGAEVFHQQIGYELGRVPSPFTALRDVNYPEVDPTGPVFQIVEAVLERLVLSFQHLHCFFRACYALEVVPGQGLSSNEAVIKVIHRLTQCIHRGL